MGDEQTHPAGDGGEPSPPRRRTTMAHTYPADAVTVISEACRRDERVRAQVEQMIVPLLDAVRIVADVWSRLPIEARMEIERMARSEGDARNRSRQLATEDDL